jgi:CheY-like chemotaxis protein
MLMSLPSNKSIDSGSLRILTVEDNAIEALGLHDCLGEMGHRICGHAYSAQGALMKAEKLRPDLVLMDILLSGDIDGIEAARRIKARFGVESIFISGVTDPEIIGRARKHGFEALVSKPYSVASLAQTIEKVAKQHAAKKSPGEL